MFNESKASVGTPTKGKLKEETTWHSGWWDFHPLAEQPQRPVEWSNSSVIFTAHDQQPLIHARHFSSSKQFNMPSPAPLLNNPSAYDPATIITASPDDDWLFAFFPGKAEDSVCCLWNRGRELDKWSIKEWWTFASGAGVVAASWLDGPREWIVDPKTGEPTRLPSRGPTTPISHPTLLFVTQDHRVIVCYLRYYVPTLKMFSCSLLYPSFAFERQPDNSQEPLDDVGSVKICINAAIGTSYDSTILIAMRSQVFPLPISAPDAGHFPLDLDMPLDMEQEQTRTFPNIQEQCEEGSTIEMCRVQLQFDGLGMRIAATPLPSIQGAAHHLREMCFVCQPPPNEGSQLSMHLIASFIEFKDYISLPVSSATCYPFSKSEDNSWKLQSETTRKFDSGILAHIAPSYPGGSFGIYASIYDVSGTQARRKAKQVEKSIGTIRLLKLPELTDDETWEGSPILASAQRLGREVPVGGVVSPGQNLLCTIFPSLWLSQISIQRLPRPRNDPEVPSTPPLALALASAILSKHSTDDLTHHLSHPSKPTTEVADTLYHVLSILDKYSPGNFSSHLGLIIESYRSRALRTLESNSLERERADANWHTAHDMCSVTACNSIFNDCKDGEEYHTDLIWQMIDLSRWIISLLEKVTKECILSSDFSDSETPQDDLFGPDSPTKSLRPLDSPVFLHLAHPTALQNLRVAVANVRHFRAYVGGLQPKTENAQLAKDVLLDIVECSGIDLQRLEPILETLSKAITDLNDEDLRRSMASCQPSLSMQKYLRDVVNSMSQSPALDKSRLFIKLFEMVDGLPRMTYDRPQKDKTRDVVSKGLLMHRAQGMSCLRCGGRTEHGKDPLRPLTPWEKSWAHRCVCGGLWTSGSVG